MLLKLNHIEHITGKRWLFEALLAPKPHQEGIYNIAKFKWQFYFNFIPLNQVTKVLQIPIPRCDNAVDMCFGNVKFYLLLYCPQGYHQILVDEESRNKLAFGGPGASTFRYHVMPVGPVNGSPIFVCFMHDMNHNWQNLAIENGVDMNEDNNTKMIVDDVISHTGTEDNAFKYMERQFQVYKLHHISLSLPKSFCFPKRVEFVGVDMTPE